VTCGMSWPHLSQRIGCTCRRLLVCAFATLCMVTAACCRDDGEARLSAGLARALSTAMPASARVSLDSVEPSRWPEGFGNHSWEAPLDYGLDGGTRALYCPGYLPSLYPEKNLGQLCGDEFYSSRWFLQRREYNPFRIAREEFELLSHDRDELLQRTLWGLGYAYIHRDCEEWLSDTALAMLARASSLEREVVVDVAAPPLLGLLPETMVRADPQEGQVAVDIRAFSTLSYDSVASIERSMRTAAARGIQAICFADRDRHDAGQKARRVAERLKRERKLPQDFLIIPGQVVYTQSGPILSLFTREIIPASMTMAATLRDIHREGGLAYLVHPGVPGGPERLANMDFDGYLMQPSMFEMFRMLSVINDAAYADKPGLTGSSAKFSGTAGLPYTLVEAEEVSLEAIKEGLAQGKASAAGELYLPWMAAASYGPVAEFDRFLNRYFRIHRYAETRLANYLGADSVTLHTTWDHEIRRLMGITGAPGGIVRVLDGTSPLLDGPEVTIIAAEYSFFRIGYDERSDTAFLEARISW